MKWVLVPLVETDEMISAAAKVKHPWDVWDAMLAVAPKREWVGLTDEEIKTLWDGVIKYAASEIRINDFARAIQAKLKEKNT